MSVTGRWRVGLLAVLLLACGARSDPPPTSSALPAGVTARVGAEPISAASVGRIALSQRLAPREALSAAVFDALLATEARASVPLGTVSSIERSAGARSLLENLAKDAERAGPPSAAELAELTEERWVELARPDAVRTTHAVVRSDKPEKAADARRVAERVLAGVQAATSADEFMRLARGVALDGFELRAEPLSPVVFDGATFERRGDAFVPTPSFDIDFARAALQLKNPGDLSPVIQTRFGFHVIRLEERIPGHTTPAAELPALLGPEVLTRRAGRARAELLKKLKQGAKLELERAHDELTAQTKFGP